MLLESTDCRFSDRIRLLSISITSQCKTLGKWEVKGQKEGRKKEEGGGGGGGVEKEVCR
jgi:hypothetical protein